MELKPQKVSWGTLDILFSSNHKVHKSSSGLFFWAPDPLFKRFEDSKNKGYMNFYERSDFTKNYNS